jgi:mercuric ion transport protein
VSDLQDVTLRAPDEAEQSSRGEGWLAAGAIAGALIASSCCILPLALVMTGISGAWIANLTALEPYKPYFLIATAIIIGLGFWHVYFRRQVACADGSYCARPSSKWLTKTALWAGTLLAALSATINIWAPWFY